MTDASGAVTLTRQYDPFGRALAGEGVSGYAFTGREWDPEIDLYFYRARYYNPDTGRFLSADPIGFGGGINLYGYVLNRPSVMFDPTGHNGALVGRLATAGAMCVLDGPLPFGEILAGLMLLDGLINSPYFAKDTELEDDKLRWDKFKQELDSIKKKKSEEGRKPKSPEGEGPTKQDKADDIRVTQESWRKRGYPQKIEKINKSNQKEKTGRYDEDR